MRTLKAIFLVFALGITGLAPAAAQQVSLQASAIVSGSYVHLGDLFNNVGEKSEVRIAYAPAPGQRTVFDAHWLYNVARAHSLEWRPENLRTRAIVERDSQVIYQDEIESHVMAALRRHGMEGDAEVNFGSRAIKMHIPAEAPATLEVQALSFDQVSGRFAATVAAPAGDPSAHRIRVSGRAFRLVEVPVLSRSIRSGDVIGKRDLEMIKVRSRRVRKDTIMEASELIGLQARRSLRAGVPVSTAMIQPPVLVKRGALVTMILEVRNMKLTAQGKAMQGGARGDFVQVKNQQSGMIVDAEITGANRVRVQRTETVAQN